MNDLDRRTVMLARQQTVALDERVWDLVHQIDRVLEGWAPGPAVAECSRLTRELAEICGALSALELREGPGADLYLPPPGAA